MENADLFEFVYEEWGLKFNSLPPAYIFSSVFEKIISSPTQFKGWIYESNKKAGCLGSLVKLLVPSKYRQIPSDERYILIQSFNNDAREEYKEAFMDYICIGGPMLMIKTGDACELKQFLSGHFLDDSESGYHKISTGLVKNNYDSKVFPCVVEIGEWVQIEVGDVLLIIWGEGTLVFTLENLGISQRQPRDRK